MLNEMDGSRLLARLDRLPVWGFSWLVLFAVGIAFFFAFYDIIVIALALPPVIHQFHTTQLTALWSVTSGLIGYIIGSFLDARIADRFGRRTALLLSILFYSVGSILCATSTNIGLLIAWRAISGMGLGAEIACSVSYLSEMAPAKKRGQYVAIGVAFGFFGFAVAPFIGLGIVPHLSWGWRLMFIIGAVGGILCFFMRYLMPETPRFLVLHHRYEEAEKIVGRAECIAERRARSALLPVNEEVDVTADVKKQALFRYLFSKRAWPLLLFIPVWFFYYISNYGWLTLNNTLFQLHGFSVSTSILFVAITSLGFILGSLVAIWIVDRVERKWTCIGLLIIWIVCLCLIAWLPNDVIILVFGFIAAATISALIPILYCYTAENFPTVQRTTSVSLSDGLGHLGGAFCGQIVFAFYYLFGGTKGSGFSAAFIAMAVCSVIAAIILLFGRRMTRRSLSNL